MKKIAILLSLLMMTGCMSEKFMKSLGSLGDETAEGYELGKRLNPIMHECNYDEKCVVRRAEPIIERECENPEKFGFQSQEQCTFEMLAGIKQGLRLKKQMLGIYD